MTAYIVLNEPLEAVVDANDAVAEVKRETNKRATGCVHPRCWGTHVEDGKVVGELHHE